MAAQLHLVLKNYKWRIETITGLTTELDMPDRFVMWDPRLETPRKSTGWARRFYLDWRSGASNVAATDMARREANHFVDVVIAYPRAYPDFDLQVVIAQDLHALDKQLRRQGNLAGYDADNSAVGINLYRRQKSDDGYTLEKDDDVWMLRVPYINKVREVE